MNYIAVTHEIAPEELYKADEAFKAEYLAVDKALSEAVSPFKELDRLREELVAATSKAWVLEQDNLRLKAVNGALAHERDAMRTCALQAQEMAKEVGDRLDALQAVNADLQNQIADMRALRDPPPAKREMGDVLAAAICGTRFLTGLPLP